MQFFDTHAHIGLIYDDPIEQLRVIQKAKQAGVTRIVSINNSLHDFARVYPTLKNIPGIYHACGVAPSEVTSPGANYLATIEENLKLPNVVAVGLASDEEHLAAVDLSGAGESLDSIALLHGNGGVSPDLGGELGLSRAHGTYQKDPSSGASEVEMGKGLVHFQHREAQTLEKIFA